MLFPDGLPQPDLFITEQLPHRLCNSVAARANSVGRCLLPAACLTQGESDVGQMEGNVLSAPSSEIQSRYQKVIQPFQDAIAFTRTKGDMRCACHRLLLNHRHTDKTDRNKNR